MHRMEALVKDWDKGLGKIIRGYGVPYQDVDDVRNDVYLDFMKGHVFGHCPKCGKEVMASTSEVERVEFLCSSTFEFNGRVVYCKSILTEPKRRTYFDIYKSPSEGGIEFIVYLSRFTMLRCQKHLTKNKRSPLGHLEDYIKDEDGVLTNPLNFVEDRRPLRIRKDISLKDFVSSVKDRLKEYPVRSISAEGNVRSLTEVFDYLQQGLTQKEIAAKLKYSEPSVCLLVKKIQEVAKGMGLKSILED